MRQHAWLVLPLAVVAGTSCNRVPGMTAVSIKPIYGWEDGCNQVKISGHGFSTDSQPSASVKTEDGNTADLSSIEGATSEIDKGYWFTATMPPAAAGQFADVTVKNADGTTSTMPQAYYYVACPAPGYFETMSASSVAAGDVVTLTGCNLTSDLQVKVADAAAVPVTTVCGEASVSFTAPEKPATADVDSDGDGVPDAYSVTVVDGAGNVVYPPPCATDTAADTGSSCTVYSITYGG